MSSSSRIDSFLYCPHPQRIERKSAQVTTCNPAKHSSQPRTTASPSPPMSDFAESSCRSRRQPFCWRSNCPNSPHLFRQRPQQLLIGMSVAPLKAQSTRICQPCAPTCVIGTLLVGSRIKSEILTLQDAIDVVHIAGAPLSALPALPSYSCTYPTDYPCSNSGSLAARVRLSLAWKLV